MLGYVNKGALGARTFASNHFRRPTNDTYVLSVSCFDYQEEKSGTPKAILADQMATNCIGASYVYLLVWPMRPNSERNIIPCEYGLVLDGERLGFYSLPQVLSLFESWSDAGSRPLEIHLHHLFGMHMQGVDCLLRNLARVPVRVYLHDYFLCCQSLNLLKRGTFCGATYLGDVSCRDCDKYERSFKLESMIWGVLGKYLDRMSFIAPSFDVKMRFCSFHPEVANSVLVVPHQAMTGRYTGNRELIRADERIRIAFLGWSAVHKGWDVWVRLQPLFHRMGYIPYVFNDSKDEYDGMRHIRVSFDDKHPEAMVDALRQQRIAQALLYTTCPETYSYTCMEAYASNVFVLTSSCSGNVADFVREHHSGLVFDSEDHLVSYLKDHDKVVNILNHFRTTSSPPQTLVVNDEIARLLPPRGFEVSLFDFSRTPLYQRLLSAALNHGLYEFDKKRKKHHVKTVIKTVLYQIRHQGKERP